MEELPPKERPDIQVSSEGLRMSHFQSFRKNRITDITGKKKFGFTFAVLLN